MLSRPIWSLFWHVNPHSRASTWKKQEYTTRFLFLSTYPRALELKNWRTDYCLHVILSGALFDEWETTCSKKAVLRDLEMMTREEERNLRGYRPWGSHVPSSSPRLARCFVPSLSKRTTRSANQHSTTWRVIYGHFRLSWGLDTCISPRVPRKIIFDIYRRIDVCLHPCTMSTVQLPLSRAKYLARMDRQRGTEWGR